MTIQTLIESGLFTVVNRGADTDRAITSVYCCDLLSVAMGHAPAGSAWVTVMGNINTLAVVALTDAACVVLAVAVATPFAIANVEFIRSAVMKLLIRIDWDEGVMQMNLVEDEGAAFDVPADWPGEYFPSYLPEGLEVTWKSYIPGYPCIEYTSESGERVINFSEMGENSTQVNGIEGAVISYMDINGQTAVVIETEHPENEADYYVGIAWDNGEKWFSVDTSGIPKEETIKIARSVKKILKN